ncbi:Asp23/Gls24 family envelope stress response protein [Streptomyces sp. NBC_00820]|uniref:Asp23/Gls24 family envelope stress response protein n=1 Tax=Streptomyces sp. NBC_00820 TaxID=2975842 RepID=UPI002ED3B307|nr:Asp23/Gls24 family envelope stress response protein [Streptomyces sp. NBC_00820]
MTTGPGSVTFTDGDADPPAQRIELPPPAERGATVIRDKAVGRIAARAARVAQSQRAALPPDPGGSAPPSASAAVHHTGSVRVHLDLDLPYPIDIPLVCERIQHDVAEQVARLTGLRVGEVTLTVRRLVPSSDARRGRVR